MSELPSISSAPMRPRDGVPSIFARAASFLSVSMTQLPIFDSPGIPVPLTFAPADTDSESEDDGEKPSIGPRHTEQTSGMVYMSLLLGSVWGASMLSVAGALRYCGVIPGVALLLMSLFICRASALLLIRAATISQAFSPRNQIDKAFGRIGRLISNAMLAFYGILWLVSYLIVTRDIIIDLGSLILAPNHIALQPSVVCFLILCVVYLFSFVSLSKLSKLSIIGTIASVYTWILLLSMGLTQGALSNIRLWPSSFIDLVRGFSIFISYFNIHLIIGINYKSLQQRTYTKMGNILLKSSLTAFGFIVSGGVAAFAVFGEALTGNVLNSLPQDSIPAIIGRICFLIAMALAFVQLTQPVYMNLRGILPRIFSQHTWAVILVVDCIVYGLGFVLQDLAAILTFTGSSVGIFVAYWLPAILLHKLSTGRPRKNPVVQSALFRAKVLFVFGNIAGVIGLTVFFCF